MRVLLTGGAGYLGGNVLAGLRSQGHEVLPVDLRPRPGIRCLDVSDPEPTLRLAQEFRPELMIHMAAIASVPQCEDDPPGCWQHNIGGTLSVARAAHATGARLIFFSSAAVYGQPKSLPTPVTEPLRPTNLYGISKAAGEFVVRKYCPESVVLRLFNVYGGACERSYVIPDVIRKIAAGTPTIQLTGTGQETRDFLHVSDLLQILAAAQSAPAGSVFNAGTGRTTTIEELARGLARLMGREDVIAEFSGPRRGDFPINFADVSEPNVPAGWTPRMALEDGLREMIHSVIGESSADGGSAPQGALRRSNRPRARRRPR